MRKHILDRLDESEIDNAFEWVFDVWCIQMESENDVLYVKPGELERVLKDLLGEFREPVSISYKTLTISDLPIEDFKGF